MMSAYAKDLAERVFWTFVGGFTGGLVITQLSDQDMWAAAALAGATSVFELFRGLAARGVGNRDSASFLGGV